MVFLKSTYVVLVSLFLTATALVGPHDDYGNSGSNSGHVVKKELRFTWAKGAPDGNERMMIFTNGQFPAPPLIFDEDDEVEVTVHNTMPFNTSVHWHGLEMQGTPWSDGVPGLTQKPIESGETFVYRFKASPPGTYWYHSHTRTTLLDGLYGPLFIRRKAGSSAPWSAITKDDNETQAIVDAAADPKFITVSDWSKVTSWEYIQVEEQSNLDIFCRDSVLINGKGSVLCPGLDYLYKYVPKQLLDTLDGKNVNDKGCLPFVPSTEGPFLPGNQSAIPPELQEGCVATKGATEVLEVDAQNGWVSLNLVMAATFMSVTVSVDKHDMWLYEVDGHYVEPRKIQAVTMYPGERYAVMMKLDKQPGDYTIRVPSSLSQITSAFGVMRYKKGKPMSVAPGIIPNTTGFIDFGGFPTSPNYTVLDGGYTHLPPFPPTPPAKEADAMHVLSLGRWQAPWRWTMSGKAIMPEDASAYDPVLFDPNGPLATNPNLTVRTTNGTWVDLVLRVGALPDEPQEISHAIHKHSSKVWFIGQGTGVWNYTSVAEGIKAEPKSFNLEDPNYRDTVMTTFSGASWFVLRYQVTNPGAWLLHCHVEIHLAGGMGMVIMDGVDKWPEIPPEYRPQSTNHTVGGH